MQLKIPYQLDETRFPSDNHRFDSASFHVGLIDGSVRELTNLRLGRNFVAATLEDGVSKVFVANQALLWLRGSNQFETQAPGLPRTNKSATELISMETLPATGKFWYLQDPVTSYTRTIFYSSRGLLVTDVSGESLILIAALGLLELSL